MRSAVRIASLRTVRIGSLRANDQGREFRSELDSHADTCVVSPTTALEIHDFDRTVRVFGYDEDAEHAKECRTVSAAVAYDHPATGDVYMLLLHQAISVPNMNSNLLSPMQMRDNDVRVNDEPKSLVLNPTDDHHAILVPPNDGQEEYLRIPLALHGVTSYFPTRKPTRQEYEACDMDQILHLTSESLEWDPKSKHFQEQEEAMLDSDGHLKEEAQRFGNNDTHLQRKIPDSKRIVSAIRSEVEPYVEQPSWELGTALLATVKVQTPCLRNKDKRRVMSITSSKRRPALSHHTLAKRWGIGLSTAERTLQATTQKGLRTVLHPTLSRRFRTNDRQLRYRRLSHEMFTDTLEVKTVSWRRKNRYAQVFATKFGWVRVFPMRTKSEAHHALSLLAQRDGVPHSIVMDGSKEQTMGDFRKKARQMDCRVKQTEPYSPWQNAAEGAIREVKRGAGRKMIKTRSPAKLWDHCLELEGYIRSNTALDIYELQGEVPETVLSGQTGDISPFADVGWYDWVFWYDSNSGFPEDKQVLGRWLGPSLDVGPAMTSKILKDNGYYIHLSSFRPLNEDELKDPVWTKERDAFDVKIKQKLGDPVSGDTLGSIDEDAVTPEYELCDDDADDQKHLRVPDIDNVTPEDQDNYVGAKLSLSFGGTMRAGQVKSRARNASGELVGTKNDNPILDTRAYNVELDDGEVAELSANVIAENMYAQCDEFGNQLVLLKEFVGHKVDATATKFADRFVTVNGQQRLRKTTTGWKLCCEWRDGTTSWERLADLKESYPVEVAEYAVAQGIDHEPAFAWWTRHVLKRRDRIISADLSSQQALPQEA